ncbi:ROK family protein [Schumannella luteola]|uniref:Glucokinase n=1 Tax=Schumannella luteola TaxID=472059 RepID=A0A852YH86_9MICO|nr:glucokinase [Schumannella luteola]TPX01345.1 ROK family protein [Schumannella luteola]
MTDRPAAGVMDIGGSHSTAALIGGGPAAPDILARAEGHVDAAAGPDDLLRAMVAPAVALDVPDLPWMIALPGPFDYPRGVGDFAGVGKFDAIAGVPLARPFATLLRTDARRIRFINDAAAFAIGEWSADARRAARFVGITLGTGVGSAFLRDGRPVESGPGVPPSGWVHLLEVDGEPLETRVSTAAIIADHLERTGRRRTVAEVADAARSGDPVASAVWRRAMTTLGEVLAPSLAAFGADELVIGGGMSRSWDLIDEPLRAALTAAPELVDLILRPAERRDDAALLGAAIAATRD